MKIKLLNIPFLIFVLIQMINTGFSQDIHFSQFYEAPLLRNPALAGLYSGDVRLQSIYRSQWQSVTVPYTTESLNGEYKLPVGKGDDFLTAGGEILYDKAGTIALTSISVLPALNYHKSLSAEKNTYLSLGFMGGLVQRRFDQSKMTTNSQFDGTGYNPNLSNGEAFASPSYSYFDASVGMCFSSQFGDNPENSYFLGAAYHHFNKPRNISFFTNPNAEMTPKLVVSAGYKVSTSDFAYLTLQGDYTKQGTYEETIAGLIYTVKLDNDTDPKYLISGGALIRWNDAIIPVLKLEKRPIAISVSYDANISKLSSASTGRGGFEMSLSYIKFMDRYNSTKNKVRCPSF